MSHPFATGSSHTNTPRPLPTTISSNSGNYSNSNNDHRISVTVNIGAQYPAAQEPPPYSLLAGNSPPSIEAERSQRDTPTKISPRSEHATANALTPWQDTRPQSSSSPSIHFIEDLNVLVRDLDEYAPTAVADRETLCSCKKLKHGYIKLPSDTPKHVEYFMNTKLSQADHKLEALIYFWEPTLYSRQPLPFSKDLRFTCVGDISIFTGNSGRLQTQFNIFLSEDENRRKGYNPPDGFTPYANELRGHYLEDDDQTSKSSCAVAGKWEKRRNLTEAQKSDHVVYSLDTPMLQPVGSALILPKGYTRIKLSGTRTQNVLQYVREQGKSWYDDRDPPNALEDGSLVVVVGCCVAPTWAVAAYNSAFASSTYADLKRELPEVDLYGWHSKNVFCTSGPGRSDLKDGKAVDNNQCVAIEGYSISLKRKGIGIGLSKMSIGSGVSGMSGMSKMSKMSKMSRMSRIPGLSRLLSRDTVTQK